MFVLDDPASLKRVSKAEQVADILRQEIATGIWKPGNDLPPEKELIERFGVSRPSYREALRLLEMEGLLEVSRGARGGAKVKIPGLTSLIRQAGTYLQMHEATIDEVFNARLFIEPPVIQQLTLSKNDEAISALAQCAAVQKYSSQERNIWMNAERQFQELLFEHCQNTTLQLLGMILYSAVELTQSRVSSRLQPQQDDDQQLQQGYRAKMRLIDAMHAGDAEKAQKIWHAYLKAYARRVADHLGDQTTVQLHTKDAPSAVV